MAFQNIREIIDDKIKQNGQQAITGEVLNDVLQKMVDAASLNMTAPILHKVPARVAQDHAYISIRHPLLGIIPDAELVLMHRISGGKTTRVPKDPPYGAKHHSSGWRVCSKGVSQGELFSVTPLTSENALFEYLVKNYFHVTFANYDAFQEEYTLLTPSENPLHRDEYYFTNPRNYNHMFGIAIRIPNPEFDTLVVGPLSKDTQSITGTNGVVHRYLYSEVAQFMVVSLPHAVEDTEDTFTRRLHILIK